MSSIMTSSDNESSINGDIVSGRVLLYHEISDLSLAELRNGWM